MNDYYDITTTNIEQDELVEKSKKQGALEELEKRLKSLKLRKSNNCYNLKELYRCEIADIQDRIKELEEKQ